MTAAPSDLTPSSRSNPCPVCGRAKDGDCRMSDALVICHRGSTFHPPDVHRRGDVVAGADGQQWAYTGDSSDGRAAVFKLHEARPVTRKVIPLRPRPAAPDPDSITLARLPEPGQVPPDHWPDGKRLGYGWGGDGKPSQWVVVRVGADGKRHIPHHVNVNGKVIGKAGPDPWPLWCEREALDHGPGQWIAEAEGEKCAAWLRAGGLVAVSQPGHAHSAEAIKDRYSRLQAAGVVGVFHLADNDNTGEQKARRCAAAAAAVGLQFLVIHAAEVWSDMPDGGSIDNAPGTPAERVAALEAAIPAAVKGLENEQRAESRGRPLAEPLESFAALIDSMGDGWIQVGDSPPHRCKLCIGDFAGKLRLHAGQMLRLNEMTLMAEVHTAAGWVQITDGDLDSIAVQMSEKGWIISAEAPIRATLHVAREQRFHPVRDYLLSIEKDPAIEPYDLDKVAPDFFRAKKSLHVAMVRKWLIGAVARAMDPGCQMDYCLVLQGGQGIGKSTALRALATPELSCSSVPDNDKDLIQTAHSCWIYELAELDSVMSRREAGRLKNLISTPRDRIRLPYGRTTQEMKRGSVFAATVNESEFLNDSTGSRRYWVVPIDGAAKLDRDNLKANRDRIWKAALAAHRAGELPMLSDHDATASETQNEQFRHDDAWLALLQSWVCGDPVRRSDADGPASVSPDRPFSTAAAIISAGLRRFDQISRADETRVAPLLRQLGFEKGKQERVEGERVRLWRRAT